LTGKDKKKEQANIDGEDRGDGLENTGNRQRIYGMKDYGKAKRTQMGMMERMI